MLDRTVRNVALLYRESPSIYELFGLPDFPYPCKISLEGIAGEIEELELQKLQGVQGLRALRVEVKV
ncbi:MAG: hypothetical protein H6557_01805 [Lewinellaceae bacterium]|nr:hypothetical protein [Lewinellaceae bacterium]